MMARTIDTLQEKLLVINITTHRKPVTAGDIRFEVIYCVCSMERVVTACYNNKLPVHQVVLIVGRPMFWEESIVHVH
jgi:hypothetical protein